MKWPKRLLRFFIAFALCATVLWAIAYFFNNSQGVLSSPPAIILGAAIIAGIDLVKVVREEG